MEKQILMIDNDLDNFLLFKDSLKSHSAISFICTYANGVLRAAEMLRYLSPSYIFIDEKMPLVSGVEVLMILRSSPSFAKAKKIFVSSSASSEIDQKAMLLGADEIIRKTSLLKDFTKVLDKIWTPVSHSRLNLFE